MHKPMRHASLLIVMFLLDPGTGICQSNNVWNGIVPLKSKRDDVEKILGKPDTSGVNPFAAGYKTTDGEVTVIYSTGPCDVNPEHGWNIPELTVVRVSFSPNGQNRKKLSELLTDRTKFERIPDPEILNVVYFTNKTDGIVLTVDSGNNTVLNLSFIPESKYDFLKCTNLSSENCWRKLKPLVSTREVVETTLGTPSARFPFYDQFDDNVGEVHVWYSACSYTIKRGQSELMIPIGRLERLVYFPKKHAPFSEYAAETRDYKRKDSPAVSGRFLYLSKNEKIMFETAFLASGEEVVMSIELSAPDLPPEAKCKELPKRSP